MLLRGRACHVIPSSCIYVGFVCLFVSFVLLSSFSPVNSKERKKHVFSNISTKKRLVLCLN
ncbi:hypothetical protein HanRHA438_Chr15g0690761 [Helianthus annuus]|nr:hypothetical protein HanRHA438_Chr15g0690761 [Helianthus annuus]